MSTAFREELFSPSVYKRTQGRATRMATAAALGLVVVLAAWKLMGAFGASHWSLHYAVPGLVLVVGLWICFRVVNWPRFADFLIAVEGEMAKVKWPSRGELIRSSIVVLVTLALLTLSLWVFDLIWSFLLINWLQIAGPPPETAPGMFLPF